MKQIYSGLENWLKAIFNTPLKNKGATFLIGTQKDGHSCGICVINSLDHEMFGTALFKHDDRNILRIRYFTEAMKYLLKEVRMYSVWHDKPVLTTVIAACPNLLPSEPSCR